MLGKHSVLTRNARDKLLSMLYTATAPEILPKIDAVKKHLYDLPGDCGPSPAPVPARLVLDDLTDNEWRQKDVRIALTEISRVVGEPFPKLIALRFSTPVLLFSSTDFRRLFPLNRERRFLLPSGLRSGLELQCVKARNPLNLMFDNAYYLIFPNYLQACLYYIETRGKVLNGLPVKLRFVNPKTHLAMLASPFFDRNTVSVPDTLPFGQRPRLDKLFVPGSTMGNLIERIQIESSSQNPECEAVEPLFKSLVAFSAVSPRQLMVVVRNLPFGLSKHTLPALLWNYDLVSTNPVKVLAHDPINQVHLQLLQFQTPQGAARFVRNFHGRKWDYSQHHKQETRFYDPILCEVVD